MSTKKIEKQNGFYCNVKRENVVLPITGKQAYDVVIALLNNYITGSDKHMSRMLVKHWHIKPNYTMDNAIADCRKMINSIKKNAVWGSDINNHNGSKDITAHMKTMFNWYGIPIRKNGTSYDCSDNTVKEFYCVS